MSDDSSAERPPGTSGEGFAAPDGASTPAAPATGQTATGWGGPNPAGYPGQYPAPRQQPQQYPNPQWVPNQQYPNQQYVPNQQYPNQQYPNQFRPSAPKPGVIPLRPLVLGELLDGTFQVMRRQPKSVFVPALIVAVITAVFNVGMTAVYSLTLLSPGFANDGLFGATEAASAIGAAVMALSTMVVTLIGTTLVSGLLVNVSSNAALGRATAIGGAWAATKPRLARLVGWSFLLVAVELGVAVLSLAPVILLAVVVSPWFLLLFFIIVPAWIALALWVLGRFSFVPAIIVLENERITGAVTRARRLTHGTFWRVLGILLLGTLLQWVVQGILATPFSLVGSAIGSVLSVTGEGDFSALGFIAQTAIQSIGQILGSTIGLPFMAILITLLYLDVRMRREGLDVTLAQHSTGDN